MTVRRGDVDWSAFPCGLGDVIVRASDGAEAWLAGALVLREDAPAAVIFVAPDVPADRAIYARPRPSEGVAWLEPVPRESFAVGAEPPSAIEIAGARFDRVRRLPLHVERVGEGAPDIGATALLGEYTSAAGEIAIVLVGASALAWRGAKLGPGDFDVWPSGSDRARRR